MDWPLGEKATELTQLVCPVNGPASVSPVVVLHTRTVLSTDPETMCWPSGESAMEETSSPTFEITISDDGQ